MFHYHAKWRGLVKDDYEQAGFPACSKIFEGGLLRNNDSRYHKLSAVSTRSAKTDHVKALKPEMAQGLGCFSHDIRCQQCASVSLLSFFRLCCRGTCVSDVFTEPFLKFLFCSGAGAQ